MDLPDYIPISMLNALVYCPRRFWLEFVLGEMMVNEHVLEGQLRHEISDAGQTEREGNQTTLRRVYVYSDRLRLSGFADLVELIAGEPERGFPGLDDWQSTPAGEPPPPPGNPDPRQRAPVTLIPVEYKKGKMGKWLNDHVQLCAQALCLEERLKAESDRMKTEGERKAEQWFDPQLQPSAFNLEYGFIFYFGSRRREKVALTPALRQKTETLIQTAFHLLEKGEMPPPLDSKQAARCRDCSLEPICLPKEVRSLQKREQTDGNPLPD